MSACSEPKHDSKMKQGKSWVKQLNSNRSPDTDLAAAATEAIAWLTTVPQETITVTVHNGWLHLAGTVNYRHQRTIVEDVTRHLPGVRGVTDSIIIEATIR
jgi:osmotically-inducible protein OsmY